MVVVGAAPLPEVSVVESHPGMGVLLLEVDAGMIEVEVLLVRGGGQRREHMV